MATSPPQAPLPPSVVSPSRPWELGAWPLLAILGKDMGALNWVSMFHRA